MKYNFRVDNDEIVFPASDFDGWAETYDASVINDQFPFTGYTRVLERIVELAVPKPGMKVLDLGTGTGGLALPFARADCELWCTDFSPAMLEMARKKLPNAHFHLHDLRTPLSGEVKGPFDRIVSSYTFHHFPLEDKVLILSSLRPHLAAEGCILIGDISFPDRKALEDMKKECGEAWEEEYYWVAEEALPALLAAGLPAQYEQVSACAGVCVMKSSGNTSG